MEDFNKITFKIVFQCNKVQFLCIACQYRSPGLFLDKFWCLKKENKSLRKIDHKFIFIKILLQLPIKLLEMVLGSAL